MGQDGTGWDRMEQGLEDTPIISNHIQSFRMIQDDDSDDPDDFGAGARKRSFDTSKPESGKQFREVFLIQKRLHMRLDDKEPIDDLGCSPEF